MTTINEIKHAMEKTAQTFGAYEDGTVCTEAAYHACVPGSDNTWEASAVKLDGTTLLTGTMQWDFDCELEDPSDYSWDMDWTFCPDGGELDLTDEDECAEAMEIV
ncbi:MAG: hypothetical protein ACYTEX_26855 [Planctomycetota bacterium]